MLLDLLEKAVDAFGHDERVLEQPRLREVAPGVTDERCREKKDVRKGDLGLEVAFFFDQVRDGEVDDVSDEPGRELWAGHGPVSVEGCCWKSGAQEWADRRLVDAVRAPKD